MHLSILMLRRYLHSNYICVESFWLHLPLKENLETSLSAPICFYWEFWICASNMYVWSVSNTVTFDVTANQALLLFAWRMEACSWREFRGKFSHPFSCCLMHHEWTVFTFYSILIVCHYIAVFREYACHWHIEVDQYKCIMWLGNQRLMETGR
jgi:hypothetical protein